MTKGIALLLFGNNPVYCKFAHNLIMSLRHFSPNVPIQLIYEFDAIKGFEYLLEWSDTHTQISDEIFKEPAFYKLSWQHFAAFDQSIYLDVDSLIIKDIEPLFTECAKIGKYVCQVKDFNAFSDKKEDDAMGNMLWATRSTVWEHFQLKKDMILPSTNSSFQYLEKGGEKILNDARELLLNNPLPIDKHRFKWGKGKHQPDELYLNASCALNYHLQPSFEPLFFRPRTAFGVPSKIVKLREDYYGIGVYGMLNNNHNSVYGIYDQILYEISEGRPYHKVYHLMGRKLAALK